MAITPRTKLELQSEIASLEERELNRHLNRSLRDFCRQQSSLTIKSSTSSKSSNSKFNISNSESFFCYRLRHVSKHDLFCSGACSHTYKMRRSQTKLRKALFSQERGVCRSCGLDCDALLVQLQQMTSEIMVVN